MLNRQYRLQSREPLSRAKKRATQIAPDEKEAGNQLIEKKPPMAAINPMAARYKHSK
jgi:hypothetical protein